MRFSLFIYRITSTVINIPLIILECFYPPIHLRIIEWTSPDSPWNRSAATLKRRDPSVRPSWNAFRSTIDPRLFAEEFRSLTYANATLDRSTDDHRRPCTCVRNDWISFVDASQRWNRGEREQETAIDLASYLVRKIILAGRECHNRCVSV